MEAYSDIKYLYLIGLLFVFTQFQRIFQEPLCYAQQRVSKYPENETKCNYISADTVAAEDPNTRIFRWSDLKINEKTGKSIIYAVTMQNDIRDIANEMSAYSSDTSAEVLKLKCMVSHTDKYDGDSNCFYKDGYIEPPLILCQLFINCFCLFIILRYILLERITAKCFYAILDNNCSFLEEKYISIKNTILNDKSWMFVFRFRIGSMNKIITYPFSLNQYVEDIVQHHRSTEELMKYEWSRYLSFKTFPLDSVMTPLRLAQAGFYYTGHGQVVKCFSCGMTNDSWTTDETAIQVHKRMSPNCEFIRGGETQNVTIHYREYYDQSNETSDENETARRAWRGSEATGGSSIVQTSTNHNATESDENQQISTHQNKTDSINQLKNANGKNKQQPASNYTNVGGGQCVKHPDYTDLAARIGSFCTWTYHTVQDPEELAHAGFFFTGVRDFVRCYFCGVGLKTWDSGDNPWTEHTHWSPSCGHLVEGRSTVRDRNVQSASQTVSHLQTSHNSFISQRLATATPDSQLSFTAHGDSDTREIDSATENVDNVMESDEVQIIMAMGYTRDIVRAAVRKYLESSQNVDTVNTESVVEILLESDISGVTSPLTSDTEGLEGKQETDTPKQTIKPSKPIKELRALKENNMLLREQMMCKICFDRDADTVFLPCGHMVACNTCALSLKKCAICRKYIKGTVLVYKP